jgi:uncharacterized membrane protein (UPF0127 family)
VRPALLAVLGFLLTQTAAGATPAATSFTRATAVVDTGERRVRVAVEVADAPEEWRVGLMNRRSLGRNAGMVFLFPRPLKASFWMKDTLIPLSIAFFDARGKILRILDMTPCRADPCRPYDPGVAFKGALEVNRGAFRRWGASRGDRIRIVR